MEKKKIRVTIQHKEGYALCAVALGMALLAVVLSAGTLPGLGIGALGLAVAVWGFLKGRSSETLDETGIRIRTLFRDALYPWTAATQVELQPPDGKDTPKLWVYLEGCRSPLRIEYTKRTYGCILAYYGPVDRDRWGKPPAVT